MQNSHLSPQIINHNRTTTYVDVNPGPGLGQAHTCDWIKSVNEIKLLAMNRKTDTKFFSNIRLHTILIDEESQTTSSVLSLHTT